MDKLFTEAIAKANESKVSKRLGCVISVHGRIVATSCNMPMGTPDFSNGVPNTTMHAEMVAIEKLLYKMGLLHEAHKLLSAGGSELFEKGYPSIMHTLSSTTNEESSKKKCVKSAAKCNRRNQGESTAGRRAHTSL